MLEMLSTILSFIFAIAVLITVHEYGHFWVARFFNVKVLKFSIGFGPTLFRFQGKKDKTEYVIAAIPLGGFVKMLDENEGEVAAEERDRAFNVQSVYKRFAIVFAGPFINFAFAVFAFFLMYLIGIQGYKTELGPMNENSIAWQSGFRQGDIIASVDGEATPTWSALHEALIPYFVDRENVTLELANYSDLLNKKVLQLKKVPQDIDVKEMSQNIGFELNFPKIQAIIGKVFPQTPAELAGLKVNDQILSIDEVSIADWYELVEYVQARPAQKMRVTLIRDRQQQTVELTSATTQRAGKNVGILGISPIKDQQAIDDFLVVNQYQVVDALVKSVEKTWFMSALTLKMLGKMLVGEASLDNISGPITIAKVAGHSYRQGVEYFLRFLAIVSLSLGVINLLPIPILDGGHLMFYLFEIVRGKSISEQMQEICLKVGIIILVMLMSIAMYNDVNRLLI